MSHQSQAALRILATSIESARKRRRWSRAELAQRVGVTRATIGSIEAAAPGVAVGTVFEAATVLGVPLFSADEDRRAAYGAFKDAELALLPAYVRGDSRRVDDDF